jgi:hypothetical protein
VVSLGVTAMTGGDLFWRSMIYPTLYQLEVMESYLRRKKAFAANVVGAPTAAVAPLRLMVNAVTTACS